MDEHSWLLRDGFDRRRMLDMDRRLQPVRRAVMLVVMIALLFCGPWLGWWTVLPLVATAIPFRVAEGRVARSRRPEVAIFAAWAASEVIIAISVALTGGPHVPTMSWLAIPIMTLPSRFSDRGIALGVALAIGLVFAVAFGVDAGAVVANPVTVVAPVALIVATAMFCVPLMRAEVESRTEAVIDPLTGMLNRKALDVRVAEFRQQAAVTGASIAVVVADLDRFKDVNDRHGHATGDAVLRDVAHTFRRNLRAFDLAYRLGGEELVVLLPGADAAQAGALAEQLRGAVEAATPGGLPVTASFGVAVSDAGAAFDWERLFRAADAALYAAKARGRNCVVLDGVGAAFAPTRAIA
jgi:diguanylate cyclase (GGDEF)-like protein